MEIFGIFSECGKNVEFLWKFCGVNIVESVSSFVSVENYESFVGLINVDEISSYSDWFFNNCEVSLQNSNPLFV